MHSGIGYNQAMSQSRTGIKKVGRPAVGSDGAERVSDWPRLVVTLKPEVRMTVDALSAVLRKRPWEVIQGSVEAYLRQIDEEDRKLVQAMVARSSHADSADKDTAVPKGRKRKTA